MAARIEERYYSLDEYFAIEEASETKFEYFRGRLYSMAGGTPAHAAIAARTIVALGTALAGRPCLIYTSDLRVQVKANGLYTHPDVTVVCGEVERSDKRQDTITNPTVIVEVLSETTQTYKFSLYKVIPSLQEYILVDSQKLSVTIYSRVSDVAWTLTEYKKRTDAPAIPSLSVTLPLSAIYDGIL